MIKSLVLLAGVSIGALQAATITMTNTFDLGQEPPAGFFSPTAPTSKVAVDGVHSLGVVFGFTESGSPSSNAAYGDDVDTSSNQLAPLSGLVLSGHPTGVLTLTFDAPTTVLSFDLAFALLDVDAGGTVTIDGTAIPFTTAGKSGWQELFSLGNFTWTSATPFTQASIAFDSTAAQAALFALDNLAYNAAVTSPVPEPGPLSSIALGVFLIGAVRYVRGFRLSRRAR